MISLKLATPVMTVLGIIVSGIATGGHNSSGNCGLTDLLSSLREASCDSCGCVTQVLVREMEERIKLQVSLDQRLLQLEENQRQHSALVREIEDRIKLQGRLDQRVDRLEQNLTQLSVSAGSAVAFFVGSGQNLTFNRPSRQAVVFDNVVTNIGGAYNEETGVFRCPVSGLYQFTVIIVSNTKNRINTHMMAGGKLITLHYTWTGEHTVPITTNSVFLELNAGDIVYVRVRIGLYDYVYHYSGTFNGLLVKEL